MINSEYLKIFLYLLQNGRRIINVRSPRRICIKVIKPGILDISTDNKRILNKRIDTRLCGDLIAYWIRSAAVRYS